MKRKEILDKATEMVCGHREQDYGSPEDNFTRIALLWSAWLDVEVTPVDVAMMMAMMKAARIKGGTMTEDSFVDGAGYFACGGEIAAKIKEDIDQGDTDGDEIGGIMVMGKIVDDVHDALCAIFDNKGGDEKC